MLALKYNVEERHFSYSQNMWVNLCILGEAAFPHVLAREQEKPSEGGDALWERSVLQNLSFALWRSFSSDDKAGKCFHWYQTEISDIDTVFEITKYSAWVYIKVHAYLTEFPLNKIQVSN